MTDAEVHTDDKLVKRKFVSKDKTPYEFDFLIIDSPDKWLEASVVKGTYDMPLLGQDKTLRFNLNGISLAEWEAVEIEHKIPKWDDKDGPQTEEFKQQHEFAIACKRAHVIEISSGKKIPGDDYSQKAKSLQSLNPGEVSALFYFIQNVICSLDNGNLYHQYQKVASENSETLKDRVVEFENFESWQNATQTPYIFRMHRPQDNYILEFPLKNISAELKMQIDSDTREPEPPKVPKRGPDKRWIANEMVPDYNDQGWLARVRAVQQKRTVLFFTACLPFTIPGANIMDQYQWLSRRLVGDVIRLRNFIEEELCEYHSRYNFFTSV